MHSRSRYTGVVGVLVGLLVVTGFGCTGQPTQPSQPENITTPMSPADPGINSSDSGSVPMPPRPSTITVSGIVYEYDSLNRRRVTSVPLVVRYLGLNRVVLEGSSDSTGRYSVSGVPPDGVSIGPAPGSGYHAPCPSGGWPLYDASFDVHVVAEDVLSTVGMPKEMPRLGPIWVSGTVFELTASGKQPVAGALVQLGLDPRFGSTTLTNSAGSYLLCPSIPGAGTDIDALVVVSRNGYRPARRIAALGWDYENVDIELTRQ